MKFLAILSLAVAAVSAASHMQLTCSKQGVACNTVLTPPTGCCKGLTCEGSSYTKWGKCVKA
ncbi:hypothetical protein ESCO_006334 [Escovopsis weberi]|uniref:Uncharacterized protein n=1 Tax=Escovopsis weberi TaxID=150374 RepID=A0A0M9VUU2_ESCWE|nr:hypothetical protein ESCO_006334 [Escovopsis weberi]